ncbi:hypothetical protein ACDX66_12795 [Peribacillus frigoritolerans]
MNYNQNHIISQITSETLRYSQAQSCRESTGFKKRKPPFEKAVN